MAQTARNRVLNSRNGAIQLARPPLVGYLHIQLNIPQWIPSARKQRDRREFLL
jgi:hypothetical protein